MPIPNFLFETNQNKHLVKGIELNDKIRETSLSVRSQGPGSSTPQRGLATLKHIALPRIFTMEMLTPLVLENPLLPPRLFDLLSSFFYPQPCPRLSSIYAINPSHFIGLALGPQLYGK